MLFALGILDAEDSHAFSVKLEGDSDLLRQTTAAYHATADALVSVVAPVTPPPTLRERLVQQISKEAICEAEQFELTANTLALGAVPIKPQDSVRERLLSRLDTDAGVRLTAGGTVPAQAETQIIDSWSSQFVPAWRHLLVTVYTSLRLCWKAFQHLLRALPITSQVFRARTMNEMQLSGKGMTFITAAEGVWRELAPGVTAKVLSFDTVSRRATTLLRIAAGVSYAPHRHTEMEELFVLEGGCSIAGREMTVGDYHRAEAGTEHHDTSSDDGCLLLIISSPQNEML